MKISESIFIATRKAAIRAESKGPGRFGLLTSTNSKKKTTETWQYSTKRDAKDDLLNRKAELIA